MHEKDRDPKEPLFKFKRCLLPFAVGNEKISKRPKECMVFFGRVLTNQRA